MKITLKSRIGNCILDIEAQAECPEKIGKAAMKQMLSHDTASEAFKDNKENPFRRDSIYSPELALHCETIYRKKLSDIGFADIVLVSSGYIAETPEMKNLKYWKAQGMSAEFAASMWAIAQAEKAKTAKETSPKTEEKPAEVSL